MAKIVPPRFNEGWGTWHAKIYGADDDVMISGANLNESYFTNRQDRYLYFSNQPTLSQYCFDFLRTVSGFSYQLLPSPDAKADLGPHTLRKKMAENAFSEFQQSYRQRNERKLLTEGSREDNQVMLFPVIQAGQFNVREEEHAMDILFKHANEQKENGQRPLIDFTSGYFGLYERYQDLVLRCRNVDVRIVAASPKANGFYGSKGVSGRIPEGYTLFEQRFMKAVARAGRLWKEGSGVQLREWFKEGWTYHAKGLWLSPNSSSHPILTLFGSTNLNSRSSHIDTELSFVMVLPPTQATEPAEKDKETADGVTALRAQLADEVSNIREHAQEWKGDQRKVRLGTKLLVALVGKML
ncbi:CDP-diacylglycerol--glycerol-3-phosphate 3-phosphatidyltransferase [Paramarasmius palmivorus]|uniref:CDP-diacylglycerol--glycerol-3-phosphate 3-phosphatidyltransferase n=1 Tax=Paramarasmius palmivorus TaxID=297713 RepID=A0AAW0BXU0_9AGAR